MNKKIFLLLFVCCAALGISSCGDSHEKRARLSKAEKARLDSIDRASFKVGSDAYARLSASALWQSDFHLFDTLGVDVHLRHFNAQMDCDTALINKRVEGSVTDLVRAARLQSKGTKLTFPIATFAYWQIISNKRSRISELQAVV